MLIGPTAELSYRSISYTTAAGRTDVPALAYRIGIAFEQATRLPGLKFWLNPSFQHQISEPGVEIRRGFEQLPYQVQEQQWKSLHIPIGLKYFYQEGRWRWYGMAEFGASLLFDNQFRLLDEFKNAVTEKDKQLSWAFLYSRIGLGGQLDLGWTRRLDFGIHYDLGFKQRDHPESRVTNRWALGNGLAVRVGILQELGR